MEGAGFGELFGKVGEFGLGGEGAEPEQVGGLLKGGVGRELVDVDAAVGEHAGFAVDPADAGVCRDNSFESLDWRRRCHASFLP